MGVNHLDVPPHGLLRACFSSEVSSYDSWILMSFLFLSWIHVTQKTDSKEDDNSYHFMFSPDFKPFHWTEGYTLRTFFIWVERYPNGIMCNNVLELFSFLCCNGNGAAPMRPWLWVLDVKRFKFPFFSFSWGILQLHPQWWQNGDNSMVVHMCVVSKVAEELWNGFPPWLLMPVEEMSDASYVELHWANESFSHSSFAFSVVFVCF